MIEITEDDLEQNFETYVERCEAGESFLIKRSDGRNVVMLPAKEFDDTTSCVSMDTGYDEDEIDYSIYKNHDEAS